jgi:hypothetical protein
MPINIIATSLMPISQAVAWYLVLRNGDGQPNYSMFAGIAGFYCAWALYNRYLGDLKQELGQYSMGLMVLACGWSQNRFASMAACGLILVNYAVPIGVVFPLSAHDMAQKFRKDTRPIAIAWAYIFKLYLISNVGLWSTVLYQLYQNGT